MYDLALKFYPNNDNYYFSKGIQTLNFKKENHIINYNNIQWQLLCLMKLFKYNLI